MKLYVKTWCPWCVAAREWLDTRGFGYELIDVEADRADYDEMIQLSGQSKPPTLRHPSLHRLGSARRRPAWFPARR